MAKRASKKPKDLSNALIHYQLIMEIVCHVWSNIPETLEYSKALGVTWKFDWPKMDRLNAWQYGKLERDVVERELYGYPTICAPSTRLKGKQANQSISIPAL